MNRFFNNHKKTTPFFMIALAFSLAINASQLSLDPASDDATNTPEDAALNLSDSERMSLRISTMENLIKRGAYLPSNTLSEEKKAEARTTLGKLLALISVDLYPSFGKAFYLQTGRTFFEMCALHFISPYGLSKERSHTEIQQLDSLVIRGHC